MHLEGHKPPFVDRWEKAFLRVAKSLGCLVRWNRDPRLTFSPDSYYPPPDGWLNAVDMMVKVKDGVVVPAGIRLDLWNRPGVKFAVAGPRNSKDEPLGLKTREAACREKLKSWAGLEVGLTDRRIPENEYLDYTLERFVPIGSVPSFGSLPELELKLAALGV